MLKPSLVHFAALLSPAVLFGAVFLHSSDVATDAEVARLRRHFTIVEQELLARDVSHLTPAQRAARARHIERLRAYARGGEFPRNSDHPGRRVPYFIDRFGTRCAMAYLIEQSGSGEYVHRVAERMNNAYIAEIARDSELGTTLFAWLDENGLTLEEAGRIQPAYDGCRGCCCVIDESPRDYTARTIVTLALGGGSLVSNASGTPPPWVGGLGVAGGIFGIVTGSAMLGDESAAEPLALTNLSVGLLATYFGLRTLLQSTPDLAPTASARLGPWLPRDGGAGVIVNVKF